MDTVTVKNVTIGNGIPKICVPIVADTKEGILADASSIVSSRADVVEWRADWFESARDIEKIKDVLEPLSSVFNRIPLLFTLRTAREGGKIDLNPEAYLEINKAVVATGRVDLIDVEMLAEETTAKKILESAHAAGVKVIGSSHQFDGTPSREEIIGRLRKMQAMGADISKIAVMPQNETDVIRLLEATAIMHKKYAEKPIAAISMAKLGVVSRITGEIFGSALTFGTVKKESAPGQIDSAMLCRMMQDIHKVI
ncbi:MAG TPA: type I 3-dehydroquinate dehydratase [Ruminococcaceae bacterium]|jgi:3-dehydroquinate dehydratase-1|nr:type I 3-dehydroquinate dehydratase [Oscillospiraceae bacterium]